MFVYLMLLTISVMPAISSSTLIPGLGAFSTHNGNGKTSLFGDFSFMKPPSEIPIGAKFNRLTILEEVSPQCRIDKFGKLKKMRMVKCLCDCGNVVIARFCELKNGGTKSCTCWRDEMAKISQKRTFTKHGLSKHIIIRLWGDMKTRCYNEKCKSYKNYGGRGITVGSEWIHDSFAFYNWAITNGYKGGLQIDRIDNNGNYEPSNCRWVTRKQQARNRRSNRWFEYNGKKMLLCDWAVELKIGSGSISEMIKRKGVNKTLEYYTNRYNSLKAIA